MHDGRHADEDNHADTPTLLHVELQPEVGSEERNTDLGQSLGVMKHSDHHAAGMRPRENAGDISPRMSRLTQVPGAKATDSPAQ
jgi:hypothetical protein